MKDLTNYLRKRGFEIEQSYRLSKPFFLFPETKISKLINHYSEFTDAITGKKVVILQPSPFSMTKVETFEVIDEIVIKAPENELEGLIKKIVTAHGKGMKEINKVCKVCPYEITVTRQHRKI